MGQKGQFCSKKLFTHFIKYVKLLTHKKTHVYLRISYLATPLQLSLFCPIPNCVTFGSKRVQIFRPNTNSIFSN